MEPYLTLVAQKRVPQVPFEDRLAIFLNEKEELKTVDFEGVVRDLGGGSVSIRVGNTVTLEPSQAAYVQNVGTESDLILNFGIPRGENGSGGTVSVSVGSVLTLPPGSPATVVNVGTPEAVVLDFGIPEGDQGDPGTNGTNGTDGAAATISVGTVSTLAAGNPATVTNVGSSSAAVFDFGIPQGAAGTSSFVYSSKTSSQSSTSTSYADVSGLSLSLGVGTYKFEFFGQTSSSGGTEGIGIQLAGTLTQTFITGAIEIGAGVNGAYTNTNVTALNTALLQTTAPGTAGTFKVYGMVTVSVAGNLRIQFRAETGGANSASVNSGYGIATLMP